MDWSESGAVDGAIPLVTDDSITIVRFECREGPWALNESGQLALPRWVAKSAVRFK
jgi:hypothetical protein